MTTCRFSHDLQSIKKIRPTNIADENKLSVLTAGAIIQFLIINGLNPHGDALAFSPTTKSVPQGRSILVQEKELRADRSYMSIYSRAHDHLYHCVIMYLRAVIC